MGNSVKALKTDSKRSGNGWSKIRQAAVVPSGSLRSKLWRTVSTVKAWALRNADKLKQCKSEVINQLH